MIRNRFFLWRMARGLRLTTTILDHWYILALLAYFFVFSEVPHLKIADRDRYTRDCLYIGNRGVIRHDGVTVYGCPILMLADASRHKVVYGW